MTFYQSRAISQTGLHVRRAAWSDDKWFMIWRGTWFCFASGNPPVPVKASDYSTDDLLATDWTTVPAALSSCPVDPGTGSTGGGPPKPGTPGFPNDPTPPFLGGGGVPPGGGSTSLPPPTPGTGVTVTITGLDWSRADSTWSGLALNKTYTLTGSGDSWSLTFNKGTYIIGGGDLGWTLTANRSGSLWDVELIPAVGSIGGFQTSTPDGIRPAGKPIDNNYTSGSSGGTLDFFGGTATVGAG